MTEAPYYAVMTNPHEERVANHNLSSIGYDTLFLHYEKVVTKSRREKRVIKPYFPRYIFVSVPPEAGFYAINTAQGVARILANDAGPARIPDEDIERLKAHADETGFIGTLSNAGPKRPRLRQGTACRIIEGPFTGFDGIVAVDKGKEIVLNVEAFGRVMKVSVFPEAVSPATAELAEISRIRA